MKKFRLAAVSAAAGVSLIAGLASATPASAVNGGIRCDSWHDSNTYGVHCYTSLAYQFVYGDPDLFRAVAHCKNGKDVMAERWVWINDGWSYAYCTSVGSSLAAVGSGPTWMVSYQ
jgi:hypothetical protein